MLMEEETLTLLGHYIACIADGDNLKNKDDLVDDSICNYLQSAVTWLQVKHHCTIPLYTTQDGSKKSEWLHPYLAEILSQWQTWGKWKDPKEPLTGAILDAMQDAMTSASQSQQGSCSQAAALYDWIYFATFTGS